MTSPVNPLLPHLARALEAVIAQVMKLDPEAPQRLAELEGQAIELTWTGPDWGLRLQVVEGRLLVKPRDPGAEPDLAVRGPLSGALAAFFGARSGGGLPSGALKMSGDVGLAKRLAEFVEKFSPDIDAGLSQRLGPIWGPQIARALHSAFEFARESARTLASDAASYLTEESREVIAREELDSFLDEVDDLRDAVDGAEQRLARLRSQAESRA